MRITFAFLFASVSFAVIAQNPISNPNLFIYNDGKDTIHLKKLDLGRMTSSSSVKLLDAIQIDGIGTKELVLFRNASGITSEHGGTFDISESKSIGKYEIWNPDTKTLLFEAVSQWSYDYDIFRPSVQHRKGNEKYSYNLIVTASGDVIIDNFCGSKDAKPDHTVGTYSYKNGKFNLKTDESAKN